MRKSSVRGNSAALVSVCASLIVLMLPFSSTGSPIEVSNNGNPVQFTWSWQERSFLESQKTVFENSGGETSPIKEVKSGEKIGAIGGAIFILAGAAAVCVIAESINMALKQYKEGGIAIEIKGDDVRITGIPDGHTGRVVFKKRNGTILIHETEGQVDKSKELCGLLMAVLS